MDLVECGCGGTICPDACGCEISGAVGGSGEFGSDWVSGFDSRWFDLGSGQKKGVI